jgi:hypothetical protein
MVEQAPASDQAPPDAETETKPGATPEPHPGHAILDEMVRTSQVQMNRSWLLRKIDELRRTL